MAIALDKGNINTSLLIGADWSEEIPFFVNRSRFSHGMQEPSVLSQSGTIVLDQVGTLTS
jgi:hypothetical protein